MKPNIKVKMSYSSEGIPRAVGEGIYHLVASFLESDIQGSTSMSKMLLQAIKEVSSGEVPDWSMTGNAHTITLSKDEASIESDFDESEPERRIPLSEFKQILSAWLTHLEKK